MKGKIKGRQIGEKGGTKNKGMAGKKNINGYFKKIILF